MPSPGLVPGEVVSPRLARAVRGTAAFGLGRDAAMAFHVGTSGWSYDHWQGVLYPHGASSLERLDHYAQRFATVEVNNTFYRWPRAEVFATWRDRLPPGFVVTVKASRGLTQFRRLNDPGPWFARMAGGLKALGEKAGVLLLQLPPQFGPDPGRLDHALAQAPPGVRLAVEFRHPDWHREDVFSLLERHGAAYCVMSGARLPCILRATADFVYVRLHGPDPHHLYAGSYSDADLHWWADRLREWQAQGRDAYAYFNNDGSGHAVRNAATLRAILQA